MVGVDTNPSLGLSVPQQLFLSAPGLHSMHDPTTTFLCLNVECHSIIVTQV